LDREKSASPWRREVEVEDYLDTAGFQSIKKRRKNASAHLGSNVDPRPQSRGPCFAEKTKDLLKSGRGLKKGGSATL